MTREKGQKERIKELPLRLELALIHCGQCHSGYLNPSLVPGKENNQPTRSLPRITLTPDFIQALMTLHRGNKSQQP